MEKKAAQSAELAQTLEKAKPTLSRLNLGLHLGAIICSTILLMTVTAHANNRSEFSLNYLSSSSLGYGHIFRAKTEFAASERTELMIGAQFHQLFGSGNHIVSGAYTHISSDKTRVRFHLDSMFFKGELQHKPSQRLRTDFTYPISNWGTGQPALEMRNYPESNAIEAIYSHSIQIGDQWKLYPSLSLGRFQVFNGAETTPLGAISLRGELASGWGTVLAGLESGKQDLSLGRSLSAQRFHKWSLGHRSTWSQDTHLVAELAQETFIDSNKNVNIFSFTFWTDY